METDRPWGRPESSGDSQIVGPEAGSGQETLADEQWRAGGLDPDGEADAGIDDDEPDTEDVDAGIVYSGRVDVGLDSDGEVDAGIEDDEPGTGPVETGEVETGETDAGELDVEVLDAIEKELADVELALERLGDGRYGQCESCGRVLSEEELQASPAGRFCPTHRPVDLSRPR